MLWMLVEVGPFPLPILVQLPLIPFLPYMPLLSLPTSTLPSVSPLVAEQLNALPPPGPIGVVV